MEITKRPIHCTDLKREILYVKDNEVWEKDNEQKENPIWWSDDTHWNARGIRIGAETSVKLIKCLGK